MEDPGNSHPTPPERLKVLDGLRACAVLLVIFMHSTRRFRGDLSQPFMSVFNFDFSNILYNGWIGVDLFFVLSGFLIARQLLKLELHIPRARVPLILHYFKVRFFRIAPAYYLTLILFLGVSFLLRLNNNAIPSGAELADWSYRLFSQIIFMHDYLPPLKAAVLWSLAVEFKFYLFAPFLIWGITCLRTRFQIAVAILILFSMVGIRIATILINSDGPQEYETYFFTIRTKFHLSLDALFAGVICALLWHQENMRRTIKKPIVANSLFFSGLVILGAASLFHPLYIPAVSFFEMAFLPTVLAISFSLLMLGLLGGCAGYKFFENKLFHGIATISYSLYLTHCFFLEPQMLAAKAIANMMAMPPEAIQGNSVIWVLSLPLFLILAFGTAFLLYKYIEKPCIDWSKKTKIRAEDRAAPEQIQA